ncbi:MAG: rhodanese-like domain-containing protein [Verrucomicrobiota bacterium]
MSSDLIRQVSTLIGLTLVAGLMTMCVHPRAPDWNLKRAAKHDPWRVTLEDVATRWGSDVLWLDSRTEKKFEAGHQPGALLLNKENWNDLLLQHFETLTSAQKPIVVYCDSLSCWKSRVVAEELRDLGIPEVYYLPAGWVEMKKLLGMDEGSSGS